MNCPCECNRGGFCGGCGHAGCTGGINIMRPRRITLDLQGEERPKDCVHGWPPARCPHKSPFTRVCQALPPAQKAF